jgi:hypothetical protein
MATAEYRRGHATRPRHSLILFETKPTSNAAPSSPALLPREKGAKPSLAPRRRRPRAPSCSPLPPGEGPGVRANQTDTLRLAKCKQAPQLIQHRAPCSRPRAVSMQNYRPNITLHAAHGHSGVPPRPCHPPRTPTLKVLHSPAWHYCRRTHNCSQSVHEREEKTLLGGVLRGLQWPPHARAYC